MDGPLPGSRLLAENPQGPPVAAPDQVRAAQALGSPPPDGTWAAVMAPGAAPSLLSSWLSALSTLTGHAPTSPAGARALAGAAGVAWAVILRPDGAAVSASVGAPDSHRATRLGLGWPLPEDRTPVRLALAEAAGVPEGQPWQVVVAARGTLALAVTPPLADAAELGELGLIAEFLAADAERSRTTREGRQRTMLEERMRVASLIHDGVTQQVSGVVIQLQLLELTAHDPERFREALRAAREATQSALEELRASLYELAPRLPEWDDLVAGLRSYAEDYSAQWGIGVTVDAGPDLPAVDPETMMLAFSVVQECLTNVRKHAEADAVVIGVQHDGAQLVLRVQDDGVGFPDRTAPASKGQAMGLRLLQARVHQAGGTMRVSSAPDHGSSITVTLPL